MSGPAPALSRVRVFTASSAQDFVVDRVVVDQTGLLTVGCEGKVLAQYAVGNWTRWERDDAEPTK
jgi:hypothetical protein